MKKVQLTLVCCRVVPGVKDVWSLALEESTLDKDNKKGLVVCCHGNHVVSAHYYFSVKGEEDSTMFVIGAQNAVILVQGIATKTTSCEYRFQ